MGHDVDRTGTGAQGVRVAVLVVDDSPDHVVLMRRRLEREGHLVRVAGNAAEARPQLDAVDIVLLDYKLPDATGLELLAEIQLRPRPPSVVLVTALGSTDVAVEAMRVGAIDYVTKDGGYVETLPDVVRRAWQQHDLRDRAAHLQRLAMLVTSTVDRDALLQEVVGGAQRLLRARSCALLLVDEEGALAPVMVSGRHPDDLDELVSAGIGWQDGGDQPTVQGERMLVPLPREGGPPLGLLVVWCSAGTVGRQDVELARAFAAFAGIALRNLRQRELEQDLVFELQQTVAARRDFLSSISHELRTPLACITGFASTLRGHRRELDEAMVDDLLDRLSHNAASLRALVEDLIAVAALDRGATVAAIPGRVVAQDHVQRAVARCADVLGARAVTVDVPAVLVRADRDHLHEVLVHLLGNAAKFSADGTRIVVRGEVRGDLLVFEVEDEGVGMDPRTARRVFDPFFRAGGVVSDAVPGSGIGLSLVRERVRSMGGDVGVRSRPGEGATFWFTLPLAPTAAEEEPPVVGVPTGTRRTPASG